MQIKMYKKIGTFLSFFEAANNGQVNVSVSSSESSGFFNSILCFLHTQFTHFAASISVLKHPKYCSLPSIRSFATHGFLDVLSVNIETPTYFEDFSKK